MLTYIIIVCLCWPLILSCIKFITFLVGFICISSVLHANLETFCFRIPFRLFSLVLSFLICASLPPLFQLMCSRSKLRWNWRSSSVRRPRLFEKSSWSVSLRSVRSRLWVQTHQNLTPEKAFWNTSNNEARLRKRINYNLFVFDS